MFFLFYCVVKLKYSKKRCSTNDHCSVTMLPDLVLHVMLFRQNVPVEIRNIIVEHYFPFLSNEKTPLTFTEFVQFRRDTTHLLRNVIEDSISKIGYYLYIINSSRTYPSTPSIYICTLSHRGHDTDSAVVDIYNIEEINKLTDSILEETYLSIVRRYRRVVVEDIYGDKSKVEM